MPDGGTKTSLRVLEIVMYVSTMVIVGVGLTAVFWRFMPHYAAIALGVFGGSSFPLSWKYRR